MCWIKNSKTKTKKWPKKSDSWRKETEIREMLEKPKLSEMKNKFLRSLRGFNSYENLIKDFEESKKNNLEKECDRKMLKKKKEMKRSRKKFKWV